VVEGGKKSREKSDSLRSYEILAGTINLLQNHKETSIKANGEGNQSHATNNQNKKDSKKRGKERKDRVRREKEGEPNKNSS